MNILRGVLLLAAIVAFCGIQMQYQAPNTITGLLFLFAFPIATAIAIVWLVVTIGQTIIQIQKKQHFLFTSALSKLIGELVGIYLGSFAGSLLLYFFMSDWLSGLDELLTPAYQAKCAEDSHHCLGSGLVVLAMFYAASVIALPSGLLGLGTVTTVRQRCRRARHPDRAM
jgi:hypothetical protein